MDINQVTIALGVCLGLASHLGYFIHGEHHRSSWQILRFFMACPVIAVITLAGGFHVPLLHAMFLAVNALLSYIIALTTSILIYRGVFHRLRGYRGPTLAKFSKFYETSCLFKHQSYKVLQKWHDEYGSYVRTGPMELSIIDPDAIMPIYGPRTKCTKGPWYDATLPLISMHQARDKEVHDRRRRMWDRGFNAQALRNYEPRVTNYTDKLLEQIRSFSGQPLNASKWFNYYSFDVMGDLAYGESFGMLENGEGHWAIDLLNQGQGGMRPFGPIGWLFGILIRVPILNAGYRKFLKFCEDKMDKRSKMKPELPDITSWLLQAEPMSTDAFINRMWALGDSRLIIVAGSDTTAATLTHVFYHLATSPNQVDVLRKELHQTSSIANWDLKDLPHLTGIINEALRMHSPVPSGTQRQTPPGGLQVGQHFIPGNTLVKIPSGVIGRSSECYQCPNEFIPERWYSRPDLVIRPESFFPFSLGVYGCIGKQLALMELRTVISRIVMEFNITLAPGEDGSKLLESTRDIFTLDLGDLNLCFSLRNGIV